MGFKPMFERIATHSRDFSHGVNWQIYLTVYTYSQGSAIYPTPLGVGWIAI